MAQIFSNFYESWICNLEKLHQELLVVCSATNEVVKVERSDEQLQALVAKVTAHLKEYYTFKWATACDEVPDFFSPPWLSPLENAFMWMTGWKPAVVLRLLETLKKQEALVLSEEQGRKMQDLRVRISMQEERVEAEMERLQVSVAGCRMMELSKVAAHGTGDDIMAEVALNGIIMGMERIMKAADCVRLKTLKGILDVLTPMQCVDFLAIEIAMHLRLRQWGKKDMTARENRNQNQNQDNNN
ncbi:hypothetical protein Fmac_008530 [Flemingia macrophylla]|uniref:DOG1 domain-containing protein n=1 Tax=Flemingia macrophylla TaxID=520843 RepID=A0ABD1MXN0_9FABA